MHAQCSVFNVIGMKKALFIFFSSLMLTGCPLEGDDGQLGATGADGINCWDTNSNRINDPEEDVSGDGEWDAEDCLSPAPTAQNPDVALNHQHLCEALANLGQYPEGCPSAVHTNPTGTLTEIKAMFDDGTGQLATSCYFEPDNGILSLNVKNGGAYWHLEGGFIASSTMIGVVDELNDANNASCMDLCQSDPECVASLALIRNVARDFVYECNLFHHSDTVQPWERFCGSTLTECGSRTGALSTDQRWSAICP